jgi:small subunit ribosomal protein S3
MGHKVPPYALRIGINRNWRSRWFFSKYYPIFLQADYLIRKEIDNMFPRHGIIDVIIERKSLDQCKVEIYAAKPGIVVGKDGQNLKNLYKRLEKVLKPLFQNTKLSYPSLDISVLVLTPFSI